MYCTPNAWHLFTAPQPSLSRPRLSMVQMKDVCARGGAVQRELLD